jgi:hypothetical protein
LLKNRRFIGAWELVSFESRAPDGRVSHPMGPDPVGTIIWDATGMMSAQLGPRDPEAGAYVAYFGMLEAEDESEGELTHHVIGASLPRLRTDQVRRYAFLNENELTLSPLPTTDGSSSTLLWRRVRDG